jgi:hypothetical protein
MSTTAAPPPLPQAALPPNASTLPAITPQDAQSLRGAVGLGLVLTMPILMALPPRRLNAIFALQAGMLGFGAHELLDYRTGHGLLWWSGKPYRWVRGVDDSQIQNNRLQARLESRRKRKEEEVKRRIEDDTPGTQSEQQEKTPIADALANEELRRSRWAGREG